MGGKNKIFFTVAFFVGLVSLLFIFLHSHSLAILDPKGIIASQQRDLLVFATILSLFVIIPVFIMTALIAWRYRETNTNAKYTPNWDHNLIAETIWWGIPIAIILVLSVITWQTTHKLDPFRPIESDKKPITIQVVALQWKWLFIYPEEDIATVNYLQIPVNRPVNFEITSDAPMNSFWIPQLGGQIYAMAGMKTKLHLMATETGSFNGSSANISGEGFAGMHFVTDSTTEANFNDWLLQAKQSTNALTQSNYNSLAKPSTNNNVVYYSDVDPELYDTIVMKYMMPMATQMSSSEHEGHH